MWPGDPDDDYDRCDYETRCCPDCEHTSKRIDMASDSMKEILDLLYGTEALDLAKLEDALEEVAHFFEMKLRANDLQIERKQEKQNPFYLSMAKDLLYMQPIER